MVVDNPDYPTSIFEKVKIAILIAESRRTYKIDVPSIQISFTNTQNKCGKIENSHVNPDFLNHISHYVVNFILTRTVYKVIKYIFQLNFILATKLCSTILAILSHHMNYSTNYTNKVTKCIFR
jgi:hypothetical protein